MQHYRLLGPIENSRPDRSYVLTPSMRELRRQRHRGTARCEVTVRPASRQIPTSCWIPRHPTTVNSLAAGGHDRAVPHEPRFIGFRRRTADPKITVIHHRRSSRRTPSAPHGTERYGDIGAQRRTLSSCCSWGDTFSRSAAPVRITGGRDASPADAGNPSRVP